MKTSIKFKLNLFKIKNKFDPNKLNSSELKLKLELDS